MTTKQLRKLHKDGYNHMSFKDFVRRAYWRELSTGYYLTVEDCSPKVKKILGLK